LFDLQRARPIADRIFRIGGGSDGIANQKQ